MHPLRFLPLLLIFIAPNLPAQSAEQVTPTSELKRIGDELANIRRLLTRHLENQELELLIRRSELASNQSAELENRLQEAQGSVVVLEGQRQQLEIHLEGIDDLEEVSDDQKDRIRTELLGQLERLESEEKHLQTQIEDLQNRLTAKTEELRDWNSLLDRRLQNP